MTPSSSPNSGTGPVRDSHWGCSRLLPVSERPNLQPGFRRGSGCIDVSRIAFPRIIFNGRSTAGLFWGQRMSDDTQRGRASSLSGGWLSENNLAHAHTHTHTRARARTTVPCALRTAEYKVRRRAASGAHHHHEAPGSVRASARLPRLPYPFRRGGQGSPTGRIRRRQQQR